METPSLKARMAESDPQDIPVMSEPSLRKLMQADHLEDSWHRCEAGQPSDATYTLEAIAAQPVDNGSLSRLLHSSQRNVPNPPWIDLDLNQTLTPQKRAQMQHTRRSVILQLVGLLLVTFAVYGIYQYNDHRKRPKEPRERPTVSEILTKAKTEKGDSFGQTDLDPQLDAFITLNDNISLLVVNSSTETWPSCEVTINGPDGYTIRHDKGVAPSFALKLKLDEFMRDGVSFDPDSTSVKSARLDVPGFRPTELTIRSRR